MFKPWLSFTPQQYERVTQLANKFNAIDYTPLRYDSLNCTAYTLNANYKCFFNYLMFLNQPNRFYYHPTQLTPEEYTAGSFEANILNLIAALNPVYKDMMHNLIRIVDRGNTSKDDPVTKAQPAAMVYFPKGITDFEPNKPLMEELSPKLQREIITENGADTDLPDDHEDKKITVRVYAEQETSGASISYIHFYFNKKSPQTLRRIWYKAIYHTFQFFNMSRHLEEEEDAKAIREIVSLFCYPQPESAEYIIKNLETLIEKCIKHQDENLIDIFAAEKQTAMNSQRLNNIKRTLSNAESSYNMNVSEYITYYNNLINARKALNDYNEVEFSAVKDYLIRIKSYPRTKLFSKYQAKSIQFQIEEPLIHTDEQVWAKYITNNTSMLNTGIRNFAQNYHNQYETTVDILKYAVQRFYKELLVDKKFKIYMTSVWRIDAEDSDFRLLRINLPNAGNFFPHPHFASTSLTCTGNSMREICKNIMENDGETAFLQTTYMMQQITATDAAVTNIFCTDILNTRYSKVTVYQRKDKTERETFESIIKEFVKDETDKINTVFDSES